MESVTNKVNNTYRLKIIAMVVITIATIMGTIPQLSECSAAVSASNIARESNLNPLIWHRASQQPATDRVPKVGNKAINPGHSKAKGSAPKLKSTAKSPSPVQESPPGQPLTAPEAVQRAEAFIVANGYTDIAVTDTQQLVPEALDKLISTEQRLKLRYNSLFKIAYGYSRRLPNGQPGWTIVFRRQPTALGQFEADQGRAVVMQLDGQNIRMFFSDVSLESVEEQLKSNTD
jgi:hypothetical protein